MSDSKIISILIFILLILHLGLGSQAQSDNLFETSEKIETNINSISSNSFPKNYFFDGSTSNLEINTKQEINEKFTFSAWIKPVDLLKKNMAIVGIQNFFWFRTTTTRELQFTQPGIADNNTDSLLLSNDNWIFVCFTIDYPSVKIYLNGELIKEFTWQRTKANWGKKLFIGKDNWQEHFHGAMANIHISNTAISAEEIRTRYDKTVAGISLTEGIVFYHSLDAKNKLYNEGTQEITENIDFAEDSVRGKTAHFAGKNCYLDFGELTIDNATSISAWVKPEVFNRDYGAITSFGHAYALRLTTGGIPLFTIPQMADINDNSAQLKLNQWHHIAATFKEGIGVNFYLNGQKHQFFEISNFQNTSKELKIGTNLWNDFFKGNMDDIIIWNRILADDEIAEVYQKPADYWKPVLKQNRSSSKTIFILLSSTLAVGVIILLAIRKNKRKSNKNEIQKNPFLEKVDLVVEQYLSDSEFSVDRFAQELFVSKTKLYNEIKKLTGKSPKEYIREQRLLKAAQLLKKTDKPIAEISFETGFESRAYFNKCFKQHYNSTPTSYRNSHLQ